MRYQSERIKYTNVNTYTSFFVNIYFFLSFYEIYLNNLIGSVTKYLILIVIFLLLLNNKYVTFKWYHLSFVMWLLLKFLSLYWSRDFTVFRMHVFSQIGMILLLIVMTTVKYKQSFVQKILNTVLYTSGSMGLLSILFNEPYKGTMSRQVLTLFNIQPDPNNMAAFYLYGITLSLYNILFTNKNIVMNLFIFIINIIAVMTTGSRGGLISLLSILIVIIILSRISNININRKNRNFILFLIATSIIIYIMQSNMSGTSYERLFNFENYSGGSNRTVIWANTFDLFKQYPVFGAGWGAYYGYNGFSMAVHNVFLQILVDGGIVGFSLFFFPIIWLIVKSLKQKKPLVLLILITGLTPSFFLDAIHKRFFWNCIIWAFLLLNTKSYSKEQ